MAAVMRTWAVGMAVAGALGACSVERSATTFPDQEPADAKVADLPATADVALGEGPGAGTMSGTWLLYHERSSCVFGQEQLTHATYLIDIAQEGPTLVETRRLCKTALTPMFGMEVVVPDAVLGAIEFVAVDRGLVSTLKLGGTYTSSTEVALWGVTLDQPLTEALPVEASDARVIDQDGDGQPGVTLEVGSECKRYQGQRQIIRYTGTFVAPNRIDGASSGVTDLNVFGASEGFCAIAPPVESNDPHSRFRMVRVDGLGGAYDADVDGDGVVGCDEAMLIAGSVLDEREVDHELCEF